MGIMNVQPNRSVLIGRFGLGDIDPAAVKKFEHDMALISQVCTSVYVLNFGTILAHGTPQAIKANPQVIEAYLGGKEDARKDH